MLLATATGCGFPFAPEEYRVATVGDEATGCDVEPLDAGAGPGIPRLLDAFALGDLTCADALRDTCNIHLSRCAETPGCIDFAECTRNVSDPTAESKCAASLQASLDAHWAYEKLRSCWAEQHARCDVGSDWSCLDGYAPPALDKTAVHLSQQLQYFLGSSEPTDFQVRLCQALTDCSSPLAETSADPCSGIYAFDILGNTEPGRPGDAWEGYRLVTGAGISPSLVVTNLPLRGRRVDVVRLVLDSQLSLIGKGKVVDDSPTVFVQVMDCQSGPAAGVRVSVPTTSAGAVEYPGAGKSPNRTRESGAAAAYNLEPGQYQKIVAELVDDDGEPTLVAEWEGILSRETITYLKLYPEPR